ncbi:MAG: murein L,D-transpeptidase YafK [Colwellia sp.]|jgi:murein L,D-transpeptidase YafK
MQTQTKKNSIKSNKNDNLNYADIVAERLENIMKELVDQVRSKPNAEFKKQLTLSDNSFLFDIFVKAMPEKAISELTIVKKRLTNRVRSKVKFFENISNNGGLFTSAEVAKLLGVSKVTVKKKKDTNKLLALNLDGEFVYPAFQFSFDDNSEKGVLKGMAEIISNITEFSDVMQYGFFVQKRNMLNSYVSEEYTVKEMLEHGISDDDLKSIIRLSKTFGTQDPA